MGSAQGLQVWQGIKKEVGAGCYQPQGDFAKTCEIVHYFRKYTSII
jgi:hypothetical protein